MSETEFKALFCERVGCDCSEEQVKAFLSLYEILTEYNEKFNLTAITECPDYLSKHIADCVAAARFIRPLVKDGASLLDVGSGAGFPSLPIAVMLPDVKVTALDSTAKKLTYIKEAAARIGADNITTVTARAEELAAKPEHREKYSIVTARAVARLNVLMELCAPFVEIGGYFIAMKGAAAKEEAKEAARAAEKLGLSPCELTPYQLPMLEDSRSFVLYRKLSMTPDAYPRQYSKIVKKPL